MTAPTIPDLPKPCMVLEHPFEGADGTDISGPYYRPEAVRSYGTACAQAGRGERDVLVEIIRECDKVISTLEPESTDEDEGLRQLLRSIKRITMLHQADERDLLSGIGGAAKE